MQRIRNCYYFNNRNYISLPYRNGLPLPPPATRRLRITATHNRQAWAKFFTLHICGIPTCNFLHLNMLRADMQLLSHFFLKEALQYEHFLILELEYFTNE